MSASAQLAFPFASLDFEGRTVLSVGDIAVKLNFTRRHVINLIESGELVAINGAVNPVGERSSPRIPLESYRAFVLTRMTGPFVNEFIKHLPRETLRQLLAEIKGVLNA